MTKEPIISFKNITKSFNRKTVVEKVSFDIYPGTINVLVGPNGAGKSTIARILLGIEEQTHGIVAKSKDLKMAYAPQSFNFAEDVPITCAEYADIYGISRGEFLESFIGDKASVDLIWKKDVRSLSSGQLQLFLISLAFSSSSLSSSSLSSSSGPDLVVLDEPTSFMDVDAESRFYQTLLKMNESNEDKSKKKPNAKQVAIFLISHDLHNVISAADQVLCINHHVCCSGKPFKTHESISANIGIYQHRHDHVHDQVNDRVHDDADQEGHGHDPGHDHS